MPKNKYIGNAISIPLNTGRQGVMYKNDDVSEQVSEIIATVDKSIPITVIGTSEFTHWPKLFAEELEKNGFDVLISSTTRAPLKIGNDIKTKLTFPDHYGEGIEHYLYNLDSERKSIFCYENEEQLNVHTFLHRALDAIAVKRNN
jgi:predicted class III extradiol MEMO1 family dioxygenase